MQSRHKMKLDPFVRLMGNASLAHILADGCYGRMSCCKWVDSDKHKYRATYKCKLCGKVVGSGHNKHG